MKTVTFTNFRKRASGYINEVEQGETVVVIRHGKPVAEITPVANSNKALPSWKQPAAPLEMKGADLSTAILDEREAE